MTTDHILRGTPAIPVSAHVDAWARCEPSDTQALCDL